MKQTLLSVCCAATFIFSALAENNPNILLIYADDLGYGDVGCYNTESKVPTPNLDRLAAEGMRFTDAHSPSTVCTPSRYSVMTGQMAFRLDYPGVFTGVEGPCLIEADRLTLPEMLQQEGYETAMFGKWHIGMTFTAKNGRPIHELQTAKGDPQANRYFGVELVKQVDFSTPIPDGPLNQGFDHFFGTVCCPTTDWLYAFVDGDRIPNPPSRVLDRAAEGLPVHPYSRDNRIGLLADDFDLEEVDMVFLEKSKQFLKGHAATKPDKPFFLFHSTQAVHLPSFPGRDFKGKTKAGPHGDFIFEFDWIVGELIQTLKRLGLEENTLVIVTSDNGPEVATSIHMRKTYDHNGARPWRGIKRDQWEGGHRVPFIAYWPGQIKAGSTSDQTISQTDLMATCAALVGYHLPDNAAEDSFNILPALLGTDEGQPIRPFTLHQSVRLDLAIRKGNWKYLDHKGSGGNRYPRKGLESCSVQERDPDAPGQLYNLKTDPGETKNLYYEHPEKVLKLKTLLDAAKQSGRSRSVNGQKEL